MKSRFTIARRALAALAVVALLGAGTTLASGAAKPADEMVPAGATVLYWNSHAANGVGSSSSGAVTVTNLAVIAEVRSLINGLPVTVANPNRVCPDDMMIPTVVSFSASASATPFTRVLFQLGGCPYARVYQHGRAVSPTLGGTTLASVYAKIRTLVTRAA